MTVTVIALVFGAIVLLLWQGAVDVAAGRMTGGTIAAFVFTGVLVGGAFGSLTEVYGDLLRGSGAAGRLQELLEAKAEIRAPANPVAAARAGARRAQRSRMSASATRPGPDDKAVHDFSLDGRARARPSPWSGPRARASRPCSSSPSGSTIRRRAASRSTASTARGRPAEIRKRMALVPQDTVLFAASRARQPALRRWDASEEEIWDAARAANAARIHRQLPGGSTASSAKAARACRAGSASASRSPARCCAMRRSCCSTRRPRARRRERAAGAGSARAADGDAHDAGHRPPAGDRARGRPDHGDGRAAGSSKRATTPALTAAGGLYARLARLQFEDRAA